MLVRRILGRFDFENVFSRCCGGSSPAAIRTETLASGSHLAQVQLELQAGEGIPSSDLLDDDARDVPTAVVAADGSVHLRQAVP